MCGIWLVGTELVALVRTDLGNNPLYQLIYFDIAYYLFSFILPLLLLAIFNSRLILTYRGVGIVHAGASPRLQQWGVNNRRNRLGMM